MLRSALSVAALLLAAACAPVAETAPCGDAVSWSQRTAEWPTDALYLGDTPLDQAEAIDLLELPSDDAQDRLAAALVVAELNLAAGTDDTLLPTVYAAHAWFSNHAAAGGADEEALALAEALEAGSICE